jgi:hypothetical protein
MLHKDYYRKGSVENNISGSESQGAWRQDEVIGGKVTLTLTEYGGVQGVQWSTRLECVLVICEAGRWYAKAL